VLRLDLTALPLSLGGAFVALLSTGVSFSMPSLNGMIDARHKRARPVIMTTLAMGAGMLPIAVGWGAAAFGARWGGESLSDKLASGANGVCTGSYIF